MWILRALDLAKCIKDLGYRRLMKDFSDTCKNCKLKYIGETSRNLHVHLKEHKRDIRIGNLTLHYFNTFLNLNITSISILQRCSFRFIIKD